MQRRKAFVLISVKPVIGRFRLLHSDILRFRSINVTVLAQAGALFDTPAATHGRLDILVDNAAANPYLDD